jgi:sulfatase modifying factor 1
MNDATLSFLVPSTGFLNPDFNADITDYTVVIPYSVTSLIVTGCTSDAKAMMDPIDGNLSFTNLTVGTSAEQTIKVTSEDGKTIKEYKVKVLRESDVIMLSDLTISAGTLSPAFNPSITRYTVTVPYDITNLIVRGRTSKAGDTMDPLDGNLLFMNLTAGIWEKKTIRVASEYKTKTKVYKIKVLRLHRVMYTSENIGELMVIPAGSFQRDEGEENISVITKPYSLSKYQITRQQFLDIMGADPSDETCSNGMKDPVQMINWYHAIAFCNKLSLLEGLTPAYTVEGVSDWANLDFDDIPSGDDYNHKNGDVGDANWNAATCDWEANGYRLPTEMEWMWAAMGADKDARADAIDAEGINRTGYTKGYAGSTERDYEQENLGDYAWYRNNSSSKTHPVGEKLPNELGLHDMSGNVGEWCWDWYQRYPSGSPSGYPLGTKTDHKGSRNIFVRVVRGGSWVDSASDCTVADRNRTNPYVQSTSVGFRILRPVL